MEDHAMAREIPVGTEHETRDTVTLEMAVTHLGPEMTVLSTPSMIMLMEQCCLQAMQPFLEAHENSVGTKVCVTHDAALRVGEPAIVRAKLAEFTGRRYIWDVAAFSADERRLGGGTHERAVIDMNRFRGG
jgi:fluoroacetyl-CoA thioesterase